ncbi:MAG: hypothetical protein Tsb0014_12040 [Pleurocapsa sp.]
MAVMRVKYLSYSLLSSLLWLTALTPWGILFLTTPQVIAESATKTSSIQKIDDTVANSFISIDTGHPTDGRVRIISDRGKNYLEFDDDFTTLPAPELKVILHRYNLVPSKIESFNYLSLAPLSSFRGQQRYLIPDYIDLSQYASVAIWCQKYNLTFAHAALPQITTVIAAGDFITVTPNYPIAGRVKIIEEHGKKYLELDQTFTTSQAPDLKVVLHRQNHVSTLIKDREYIKLASLKKINGRQRYPLPQEIDAREYASVVIWCDRLNLTIGYATL